MGARRGGRARTRAISPQPMRIRVAIRSESPRARVACALPFVSVMKPINNGSFLVALLVSMAGIFGGAAHAAAQEPPPIDGVTGTVALEGTLVQEHAAANTVIVKTVDGVEHLFHFTKDLLVHGGKGSGVDALQGLRDGTTVAVHYTVVGGDAAITELDQISDEGLVATEGTVVRIDRSRKHIIIRFDNGKTEVFELTERAASGVGKDIDRVTDGTARVTVYYRDEDGHRIAHFFKRTS
jgi:hypothetical protein